MAFLYFFPDNFQILFLLAFIPGILAVATTILLKEPSHQSAKKSIPPFHQTFSYWKQAPSAYKKLIGAFIVFALVNSSDVFLLLKIKEAGLSDTVVIGVYIFYNLVFAVSAYPLGRLADRWGMKTIFITGLFLYVITYTGFAFASSISLFLLLFVCYGLYAAATEGVAKAWISTLVSSSENASAIGFYTWIQSVAALTASAIAGIIWVYGAPVLVFLLAAAVAACVACWLHISFKRS